MKKFILFLASVFMLASCNDKVLIDYGYDQPSTEKVVNFGTNFYMPGLTKSIIDGVDSLKKNNFAVYAKINGNLNELGITLNPSKKGFFIYGDTLAWANSKWALKNKTYLWPNAKDGNEDHDPTINFFAYGPIEIDNEVVLNETDSTITIDVNPIEKDNEIKDLVYAKALKQTYKSNNGVPKTSDPALGYVKFNFQHQLSWVEFKGTFTASEGIDSVTIDSVVAHVDNSTATYVINTKADYKDTLTNAATPVAHNYVLDSLQLDSTKYQVIGSFVALPQTVSNAMTAKIYYTLKTADGEIIKGEPEVKLNYGTLHEDYPSASATAPWTVAKWQKGYKYIYRINVKPREILFTATVESWNPTGTIPEYLIY